MADKLVMGGQKDSLGDIKKFGGMEANVTWPHFFQDVENALRFEMGNVGIMILNNTFPVNSVQRGGRVDQEPGLIKMLLSTNRSSRNPRSSPRRRQVKDLITRRRPSRR